MTPRCDPLATLVDTLPPLGLEDRLAATREALAGRLVFTTSFGLEDQALTHAIAARDLEIEIVTLDTGRLFAETYDLWAQTERRYGLRIKAHAPSANAIEAYVAARGINGFRQSVEARLACCGLRKVEPLGRALAGAAGWITGLRAGQSRERAATLFAAHDADHATIKINPLADWRREAIEEFIAANDVPVNALHARGFPSIGCAPCTRAVKPGESERAGRWWWEDAAKKECGLHLPRNLPLNPALAAALGRAGDAR